jgi:hypothetical protein
MAEQLWQAEPVSTAGQTAELIATALSVNHHLSLIPNNCATPLQETGIDLRHIGSILVDSKLKSIAIAPFNTKSFL